MNDTESVKPLARLIDKFLYLGRARFSGKIHDNVLNILDQMELDEQKNLLRGLINLYLFSGSKEIFSPEISDKSTMPSGLTWIDPPPPPPSPSPVLPNPDKTGVEAANDAKATEAEARTKKNVTLVVCLGLAMVIIIFGVTLMISLLGDGVSSLGPLETVMKYSATLMPFFK